MKQMMTWMATAASLTFAMPGMANQKNPRLDALFERLQEAETAQDAHDIEQTIWRIWTSSGNMKIDTLMAEGIVAMAREKYDRARNVFDEITRRAPDYAEGWNKRATLNFLTGDFTASVADVEHTLMLEPRHFGALSGLGLISLAIGEDERALEAFEAALFIHPRMTGATDQIRDLRQKLHGRMI